MYSVVRTSARPPKIVRAPGTATLSRARGAGSASDAIRLPPSRPSSGSEPISVHAVCGPTPGTLRITSSRSRLSSLAWIAS